jgi:two-component system invasion response regulator UvrY
MILPQLPAPTANGAGGDASGIRRLTIVKWDRLTAAGIRDHAAVVYPQARFMLCHAGADALAALRRDEPDFALVGLTLPDMDGLDLLASIVQEKLARRVLVISGRRDERTLQVLRQVRVHGYFDSEVEPLETLPAAIRKVGEGGRFFSGAPQQALHGFAPLSQCLSMTELQVFAVIGDGTDNEVAAERLGLAPDTVKTHRQRIMRKLDVQTRADLVRTAMQLGVVRLTPTRILYPGLDQRLCHRHAAAVGFADVGEAHATIATEDEGRGIGGFVLCVPAQAPGVRERVGGIGHEDPVRGPLFVGEELLRVRVQLLRGPGIHHQDLGAAGAKLIGFRHPLVDLLRAQRALIARPAAQHHEDDRAPREDFLQCDRFRVEGLQREIRRDLARRGRDRGAGHDGEQGEQKEEAFHGERNQMSRRMFSAPVLATSA